MDLALRVNTQGGTTVVRLRMKDGIHSRRSLACFYISGSKSPASTFPEEANPVLQPVPAKSCGHAQL